MTKEDSVVAEVSPRDKIRAEFFSSKNKKVKTKIIELFDQEVELRQPTVGQLSKLSSNESTYPPIVHLLIDYVYVPGTDTRIFDMADAEQLASMPTGKWMSKLNEAYLDFIGIDVAGAEKNSKETD